MQTLEETETMKKWRKQQFEREQWKKEQGKSKEVREWDESERSSKAERWLTVPGVFGLILLSQD